MEIKQTGEKTEQLEAIAIGDKEKEKRYSNYQSADSKWKKG